MKEGTQKVEVITVNTRPDENMSMREKNTNVSCISGLTSLSHVTNCSSSASQWGIVIQNACDTIEGVKKEIDILIQRFIFPKLKFIVSRKILEYSENEKSLCQTVCQRLNVNTDRREGFWNQYSRYVDKMICVTRANKTSAMKKGFMGKMLNM